MKKLKNKTKPTKAISDDFGDLEEKKVTNDSPIQTQQITLSKEALDQLDEPKVKQPDISWPQVISEYIDNYPNRTPEDIGTLIKKDYKLTTRRAFPTLGDKHQVALQIIAFNKAYNRALNFKEGSIRFPTATTLPSSNQKKSKKMNTPSIRSFNQFQDVWEKDTINEELIPQSQVSKRQKVGDQWEKKITKNVVNRLKVLIDQRLVEVDEAEAEEQGHFSPSQFIKENPMVTLAKDLADITNKAQETSLAIEESEQKIKDATRLVEEKIIQLRKELAERVEIIDQSIKLMKEEHVKLLDRSSSITQNITDTIEATHKHHNYK